MSIIGKSQLFLLFLSLAMFSYDAYAYFDPGTGSILIQILIALIGSIIVFFHRIIFELKNLQGKLKFSLKRKKPGKLDQSYLLAASIGAYAALFYGSHNIQELTIFAFILNIFLFSFSTLLLTAACIIASKKTNNQEKFIHGALFLIFIYYMRIPVAEIAKIFYVDILDQPPTRFIWNIFTVALCVFFFSMGRYLSNHTIKVIVIIAVMSLLPMFKIVKGVYTLSGKYLEKQYIGSLELDNEDIILRHKPNVYFLLFDSYSNSEGLDTVGLSTSPQILKYLDRKKFTTYQNFYTNMQSTRNAICTYFSMNIELGGKIIYDIYLEKKQRISGGDNPVFSTFRKNGYITQIVMVDAEEFNLNAYMRNGHCFASRCTSKESNFLDFLKIFDKIILNGIFGLTYTPSNDFVYINMQVLQQILKERNMQASEFVYVHFMPPGHSIANQVDGRGTCNMEEETTWYEGRLNYANSIIARSVDMIEKSDPNALIILASDHGAYILNRCSYRAPLLTREEVVERQGVFLAIKWGKDYDGRYDKDIKSSANLFRYIFSYLAGNEKLLYNKPDDDAFYQYKGKVIKSIDDGVILPPPAAELNNSN